MLCGTIFLAESLLLPVTDPATTSGRLPAPCLIGGSGAWPILLSVPHSGRTYPDWLIRLSRSGMPALRVMEDPLVDRLVWRAQALGIACVVAQAPRAAIDCNRAEDELDPAVIRLAPGAGHEGWRVRAGLGLVPARAGASGSLWRRPIGGHELDARLADAYRPYHALIAEQLALLGRRHRQVLLLDCHSMPWRAGQAGLVIGDRHSATAAPWLADLARRTAEDAGVRTVLNEPYAGGQIVTRHGRPAAGVHALQLEWCRRLYLDSAGTAPGPGFDAVAQAMERIARTLGDALLARNAQALAAE